MLGWTRPLGPEERAFVPARYAELPTLGRLTGRGNTANVEVVLAARPDLIFDYGSLTETYRSLADRVQQQTGVPYLLFDGSLSAIPDVYARVGDLLGVGDRGRELGRYAARLLAETDQRVARVPAAQRPSVYYARGPKGLDTAARGSITVESLERLGARNVADEARRRGGHASPGAGAGLGSRDHRGDRSGLRGVGAHRSGVEERARGAEGRVYLVPQAPFPWMDFPPSVNRLIGLKWLGRMLYPAQFPEDLRQETRSLLRALLPPGADRGAARHPRWRGSSARAPDVHAAPTAAAGRRHEAAGFLLAARCWWRSCWWPSRSAGIRSRRASCSRSSGPSSPGRRPRCPPRWRPWSSACAGRACSRRSPSAPRWPPPARPTRGCSATRWSRPTSSACPPARRSAPCSASIFSLGVRGHPGPGLRGWAWPRSAAVYAVGASLRAARSHPRAGAGRHRHRHAARLLHLAARSTSPIPTTSSRPSRSGCSAASPSITAVDLLSILPGVLVGLVPLWLLRWRMNVMTLERGGGAHRSAWTRGACGSS